MEILVVYLMMPGTLTVDFVTLDRFNIYDDVVYFLTHGPALLLRGTIFHFGEIIEKPKSKMKYA